MKFGLSGEAHRPHSRTVFLYEIFTPTFGLGNTSKKIHKNDEFIGNFQTNAMWFPAGTKTTCTRRISVKISDNAQKDYKGSPESSGENETIYRKGYSQMYRNCFFQKYANSMIFIIK